MSKSLLEIEESCKWPMITIVNIIDILIKIDSNSNDNTNTNNTNNDDDSIKEKRNSFIEKLIAIDPIHRKRYIYLLN